MQRSYVMRVATCMLIATAVLTGTLLYAENKDDFVVLEGNKADFKTFWKTDLAGWDKEDILYIDPLINNGYRGEILAQAKGAPKKAGKRTAYKSEAKKSGNISMSVNAAYLMPMGDWKKLIDPGYGGMLGLYYDDIFFKNFSAGIETGYIYTTGKDDSVKSEYIVPALAAFGYSVYVAGNFGIAPRIGAGLGYFNLTYKPVGASEKTKAEFELMAKGGLSAFYDVTKTIALQLQAEYGMVFEKDGRLPFVLFQLGCNINF